MLAKNIMLSLKIPWKMVFLVSRAEVGTKTHREGIFIVFRSLHFIIGILQGA